jgi:hypothetical protein
MTQKATKGSKGKKNQQVTTKVPVSLQQLEVQVKSTGFPLENDITRILKSARWTVISNKYYVDDQEGTVREMDLIAYKATKAKHLDVYTTLIISCKKSETDLWALLARDIDLTNPNMDWRPVHSWTNDPALEYQIKLPTWAKSYYSSVANLGIQEALRIPSSDVFAYQEMDSFTGAPHDSKKVYSSITSLMKAQSYELNALPQRKTTPAVYQFNLISIIDGRLVKINFEEPSANASDTNSEHYVARYILHEKETFSRIHFVRADNFETILKDYDKLHNANCVLLEKQYDAFYFQIEKDPRRLEIFKALFVEEIDFDLRWTMRKLFNKSFDVKGTDLEWRTDTNSLAIVVWCDKDEAKALNANEELKKVITKALKEIYKYTGNFYITVDDVPF